VGSEAAITTVLFDAGGTLVHLDYFFLHKELRRAGVSATCRAIRRAEYAARREVDHRALGLSQDTDETRRHPYFSALLKELRVDETAIERLLQRFETAHRQDNLWRVMMPSTPRILTALRTRGVRLGVVSNADGRIVSILRNCGIEQFFDVVIDSHHVGVEKPDPQIFHVALARAQARAEQTIFVGDIYSIDVLGAQRAGLRPLLIDILDCYDSVQCEKIRHLGELLIKINNAPLAS
jgi:putative hydrolase of the HAD superfamily